MKMQKYILLSKKKNQHFILHGNFPDKIAISRFSARKMTI